MIEKVAFTSKERQRILKLRCASKRGYYISQEDMEFLQYCYKQNPEEYQEIGTEVFEMTKPYGARL